jgi:hypothetical protein
VVYGWGKGTKETLGTISRSECSHCHKVADFHLVRRKTWFTLYFVPVLPYGDEHFVLCTNCEWGWKPNSDDVTRMRTQLRLPPQYGKLRLFWRRLVQVLLGSPTAKH